MDTVRVTVVSDDEARPAVVGRRRLGVDDRRERAYVDGVRLGREDHALAHGSAADHLLVARPRLPRTYSQQHCRRRQQQQLLLLLLLPFTVLFSRTTWVSRYQKGQISLDLNEARDDGVLQWH